MGTNVRTASWAAFLLGMAGTVACSSPPADASFGEDTAALRVDPNVAGKARLYRQLSMRKAGILLTDGILFGFGHEGPTCQMQISRAGACIMATCPSEPVTGWADMGEVRVHGGLSDVSFTPTQAAPYSILTDPFWQGGNVVRVTNTGAPGGIGRSTARLVLPGRATVVNPSVPVGGSTTLQRSSDLLVDWAPPAGPNQGDVLFRVQLWSKVEFGPDGVSVPGQKTSVATCTYPVAAGHGVVPAAAIASIHTDTGALQGDTVYTTLDRAGNRSVVEVQASDSAGLNADVTFVP